MLRDEDGMAAKRGLSSVVHRLGRRKPPADKRARVLEHGGQATRFEVGALCRAEPEAPAKGGTRKPGEDGVQIDDEARLRARRTVRIHGLALHVRPL